VSRTFFDPEVLVSFLFLALLIGFAAFLFIRSRSAYRPSRLIAFGIFWFFITLSVESSIIPIADVMVEHRLYLPGIGAFIALVSAGLYALEALQKRYRRAVALSTVAGLLLIVILSATAYFRNAVWASELTLWTDAVQTYPGNARAHNMLGIIFENRRQLYKATAAYRTAITLKPVFAEAHVNLGRMYVDGSLFDEAMREFMIALNLGSLDEIDTANLYINIGYCYQKKGLPDKALEFYHYAAAIVPDEANVYSYIASAYETKGMQEKAVEYFRKARQLNPDRY
jgi:tetratricopeptide (TPR) repeat protein